MNFVMASVLLLAMLAFQPTLIYGTKNLASARNGGGVSGNINNRSLRSLKYGKRHSTAETSHLPALSSLPLTSSAKLVMSLESGDVLVRSARGAATTSTTTTTTIGNLDNQNISPTKANGNNDGSKRQKNNKKLNKNLASQDNNPTAAGTPSLSSPSSSSSSSANRRKHSEKKFSATSGLSSNHHQQQHSNKNNGNKQRQMLKSQNHQNKRSGIKANREHVEKIQSENEKPSTTCRYAKSAWSECDPKTNMRSRTLTLKKGESNCLETRTMQKKCRKSCRYEKGAWSECINGQMTREDKLKATGGIDESSCEAVRSINKKCNPNNGASKQTGAGNASNAGVGGGKKERKHKEKGSRRVIKN